MPEYIALAWNASNPDHRAIVRSVHDQIAARSPNLVLIFDGNGLSIHCSTPCPRNHCAYLLSGKRGVVLGRLFSCMTPVGGSASCTSLDERLSDSIYNSRARHLVEEYWGRYVAFVHLESHGAVSILRDPTGALPCFVTNYRGVEVVCSRLGGASELGLVKRDINWEHVAAYLCFDNLITKHTGLTSVAEVHAGECVTLGGKGRESDFYWIPSNIAERRTFASTQVAKRDLRLTIQSCVTAWASCYGSILHELSGGLDSSIVLACLSRSGSRPTVICENHFTQDAAGDERNFARLAANAASIDLVETPIPITDCHLKSMFHEEEVASPAWLLFVPATQISRNAVAEKYSVEAVFSGQGGDHFFQSIRTKEIAAEYVRRIGIRRGLMRTITDTSLFTRQSVWSVGRTAIASGLFRIGEDPYHVVQRSPLLSDANFDLQIIRHPWVNTAGHLPASKQRQIFDIIDTQNFYRRHSGAIDVVHPLISQPIIELCLQIPSFLLTYGGVDRALVRDAFRGAVPDKILDRTVKGATTGYHNDLLQRNASSLRSMLLDGNLVHAGVISKRKVEAALSEQSLVHGSDTLFTVLNAFRAELWSRQWSSTARQETG